jgi:hypothetical protein
MLKVCNFLFDVTGIITKSFPSVSEEILNSDFSEMTELLRLWEPLDIDWILHDEKNMSHLGIRGGLFWLEYKVSPQKAHVLKAWSPTDVGPAVNRWLVNEVDNSISGLTYW